MRTRFLSLVLGLCLTLLCSLSSPAQAATTLDAVLRFFGITANPSAMKGDGIEIAGGDIWVANLERGTREALTTGGNYRWPVFEQSSKSVVALTGDRLVRIAIVRGAKAEVLHSVPGIVKLVGFDRNNPDRLLVTRNSPESPLAILSVKSGKLTLLPYDPDDKEQRRMLTHIRGDERTYAGARVCVKTESTHGIEGAREWTDVYIQRGPRQEHNVSHCNGIDCGQPSLSPDERAVVFIQSRR